MLKDCPKCAADCTYEDGDMIICPMCAHEWHKEDATMGGFVVVVKDSNGNELQSGDSVTVIKDLKVGSSAIKKGTKVKNIRLVNRAENNDHDIDCKVDGFGAMLLKSEYVKKL